MGDDPTTPAWQRRFEVLGLLAVLAAVAVVVSVGLGAYAQHLEATEPYAPTPDLRWVLQRTLGSISPLVAGLVVAGFLLVVAGPGSTTGPLGRQVLWAVVGVGLVLGVGAVGATLDWFIGDDQGAASAVTVFPTRGSSPVTRVAAALPSVAVAGVLVVVAWCAWNLLAPPAAAATSPDEGSDPVGDAQEP